jgi:hypothetical protein
VPPPKICHALHLARVQAEGIAVSSAKAGPCPSSSRARCGRLHGAVLHRVEHLQAGTISPAANTWIWNLPPVAGATRLDICSAARVDGVQAFGKLDASRHLTSGTPCAKAGRLPAARMPAMPAPAVDEFSALHCFLLWVIGAVTSARAGLATSVARDRHPLEQG